MSLTLGPNQQAIVDSMQQANDSTAPVQTPQAPASVAPAPAQTTPTQDSFIPTENNQDQPENISPRTLARNLDQMPVGNNPGSWARSILGGFQATLAGVTSVPKVPPGGGVFQGIQAAMEAYKKANAECADARQRRDRLSRN